MKERIKQFMDYKGVSAGDLASVLNVQRSNISHILNGRNKPGANFIEKFLINFPDLNARWLLTGNGHMINENLLENSTIPSKNSDTFFSNTAPNTETENLKKTEDRKNIRKNLVQNSDSDGTVEKVILLYSDGSFKSYNPESK